MRLLMLSALIITQAYAHETQNNTSKTDQEILYANIYADALIEEFDRKLDLKHFMQDKAESILYDETYARLLSARSYLESSGDSARAFIKEKQSFLKIQDSNLYIKVIREINKNAIVIKKEQRHLRNREKSASVIYPSISEAGNVTGNTFPKNVWTLTFDDGPRPKSTKAIVDNLYRRNINATFYMLTAEAKKYQSEAFNVKDSGMTIALHSYSHPDLSKATDTSLAYQITQAKKDLENLMDVKVTTFRLPYGAGVRNSKIRSLIAKNNMVHIFWNVDTLDWKDKDPESILARTKKQMSLSPKNSGVILFHDIHATTVKASELTMDYILDAGNKICTVEEVINHINGKKEDCLL
jgi:peptidoglycan/xylan/chitin deacetylase (PgdA/CDA1 family)